MAVERRVLVTGASRGIGREIAKAFAESGATVIASARSAEALAELAGRIRRSGGSVETHVADLSDRQAAARLAEITGPIDVLVNNAAAMPDVADPMPLVSTSDERWDEVMTVNLRAPYVLSRTLAPGMRDRGGGCIVNISAMGARWLIRGLGIYCISKAALDALTQALASELGPWGIRCNALAPGPVMNRIEVAPAIEEAFGSLDRMVPLGRAASKREIADAVVWLASDAAAYLTGQVLVMDGGVTAGAFHLDTTGAPAPPARSG